MNYLFAVCSVPGNILNNKHTVLNKLDKIHKEKCTIDVQICIKGQMVIKAIKKKSRGLKKKERECDVCAYYHILFYLGRPGMTSIAR